MRIHFDCEKLGGVFPEQLLRRAGYAVLNDRQGGSTSFVRRLSGGYYPRFHIYMKEDSFFDIHLDQKQVSYKGHTKHSGEYDGKLVKEEAERILSFFN